MRYLKHNESNPLLSGLPSPRQATGTQKGSYQSNTWTVLFFFFVNRSVVSKSLQPMDSIVHGILQARILAQVAIPFLQGIFPTQG